MLNCFIFFSFIIASCAQFDKIASTDFKWLNQPKVWNVDSNVLLLTTDNNTDFWQGTWYNFYHNSGHVYGVDLNEDFTLTGALMEIRNDCYPVDSAFDSFFMEHTDCYTNTAIKTLKLPTKSCRLEGIEACIEANFTTLYDQAGLMIYVDDKHWIKAGIEYNDGQPMIGSVHTNGLSDWATGVYTGNARKFWLRLSKVGAVVCIKYSADNVTWILLRLAPFPVADKYFVGPMA